MKTLSLASAIACVAVALVVAQAQAQTIKYEVRVPGYSNSGNGGWIELRPGSNTGGKIINAGTRNAYTDRVTRVKEELRVSIIAPRGTVCECRDTIVGVVADNGFVRGKEVKLPFVAVFRVSSDPSFDNVTGVAINKTNGNVVTLRVPIGTR